MLQLPRMRFLIHFILLNALVLPATVHAQAPTDAPAKTSFSEALRGILTGVGGGKVTVVGAVLDLATGETVLDLDGKKLVHPASVAKLFSTAAVMKTLPADKVFVTEVRGSPVKNGEMATLALIGSGDPTMFASDYAKLATEVQKKGITKVAKLIIDGSVFDDKLPKSFDEKQTDAAFRAPIGGLQCEAGTVHATVKPAGVGEPPIVELSPPAGDAVVIINEAKTVAGKKDALVVFTRPSAIPGHSRVTEVVVQGTLAVSHKVVGSGRRRVADATYYAGWVFQQALQKRGVAVPVPTFAKAPELGLIASRSSPKLQEIVSVTNKTSHNGYAETMFRQTAAGQGQVPVTNEKAEAAVRKTLETLQIRWNGSVLGNGSGLYHADKVTAQTVVDLLRAMHKDPAGANWRKTLTIAGVDGTLRGRLHDPATQGKIQGKTGTLDDVVGLAGYAEAPEHTYVFAVFYNGIKGGPGPYRAAVDRMLKRLLTP
jgi:D-alanyl-D-alanine carboxypeptidase/D-alanyl-D-alanine-endopeptidase (penicillin-binding protein 4)